MDIFYFRCLDRITMMERYRSNYKKNKKKHLLINLIRVKTNSKFRGGTGGLQSNSMRWTVLKRPD